MISAASHHLIFFAMAFNSTSCSFIIRSTSAVGLRLGLSNPQASPPLFQSGQIMCELDRTNRHGRVGHPEHENGGERLQSGANC
jgi:hypothetical protein